MVTERKMNCLFFLTCFCTLQLVAKVVAQSEQVIHVWPSCTTAAGSGQLINGTNNCTDIDQACRQLLKLTADTVLILHSGRHILHDTCFVSGFRNLSLIGEQMATNDNDVTIACDAENGLVLMNISGFHMQGITIENCGVSGPNLEMTVQYLNRLVNNFLIIPTTINIAVILVQCEHLSLERITVTNTIGLGLLGVNILGNSSLQDVTFRNNTRRRCITHNVEYPFRLDESVFNQIGGGAYFLYLDPLSTNSADFSSASDHKLVIMDSDFQHNSECSFASLSQTNFQYFHEYINYTDYTVGAGGGLSIFLAQLTYLVEVNVHSTTFANNDARYGGGVYLAFFLGVQHSGVRFMDCSFENNGLLSNLSSFSRGGAGMAIFTDILRPNDSRTSNELNIMTRNIFVELADTNFTSNGASVQGGGLLAYSHYHTQTIPASIGLANVYVNLTIVNCVFHGNMATYGSGAFLKQRINQGVDGGVGVWIRNTQFNENGETNDDYREILVREDIGTSMQSLNSESSAFAVESIQMFVTGTVVFSNNAVTGCSILSSTVHLTSNTNVNFLENQGHLGGAVRLQGSIPSIFMSTNTKLSFSGNTATRFGGAIYYAPFPTSDDLLQPGNFSDCFFFPSPEVCPAFNEICDVLIDRANVSLEFTNNRAQLGSSIYGATLESCPWTRRLLRLRDELAPTLSLLEFISKAFPSAISFNDNQDGPSVDSTVLSTPPADLQVAGSNQSEPLKVFPGEQITLSTTILDSFGQPIPAVLTSYVSNTSTNATARLGDSGFWFADQEMEWTPLTVTGDRDQTIDIIFSTFDASVTTELSFEIRSCPLGFVFSSFNNSCVCDERLLNDTPIKCDMINFTLIVPKDMWIGPISGENSTNDDLVVHRCVREFCEGETNVRPPNFDSQCTDDLNRKGLLCGACETNYSIAFGNKVRCNKCSNYYIFTIALHAAIGILLFVTIALLGITVDKGWINMVLFYSNGVYSFSYFRTGLTFQQIFSTPLATISLKLAEKELCFYDGMTALEAVALQFVFPLYLYLLMIIFALIARRSVWLSSRFSLISTFVTLAVMSYVSMLEDCIEILGPTVVTTLDNRRMYRWILDPTQGYFSDWHALLGIIALVILVLYVIPVPVFLMFPSTTYRCFGTRLKPFLDALYAPFELKYRFWIGLRLVLRAVFFLLNVVAAPLNSFVITLIILVCLTHVQLAIRPFKNKWQNILDSTLIVDFIILVTGGLYFEGELTTKLAQILGNLGLIILVGGAYVLFVCIIILHLVVKYPFLNKPFVWIRKRLSKRSLPHVTAISNALSKPVTDMNEPNKASEPNRSETPSLSADEQTEHSIASIAPDHDNNDVHSAATHAELYLARRHGNFTDYRESIVEDFVLESVQ